MNDVKVNRIELLDVVKKNRDNHRKIFEEAVVGYREQAIKELGAHLKEARAGGRIRRTVTLVQPIDQTIEYDRAIKMLEMSVDDTVTLDEHTFQCLVMDDWGWKKTFLSANAMYSKTANDTIAAERPGEIL